jgi:hypothetical protein
MNLRCKLNERGIASPPDLQGRTSPLSPLLLPCEETTETVSAPQTEAIRNGRDDNEIAVGSPSILPAFAVARFARQFRWRWLQ